MLREESGAGWAAKVSHYDSIRATSEIESSAVKME